MLFQDFFPTDVRFLNMFLSMFFSEAEHVQKCHRASTKPQNFSYCVLFHNILLLQNQSTDERASLNTILWHERTRAQSCLTLATPWTAACQALSVGFPRQEYWRGLSFSSPGDLPDSGLELASLVPLALASGFFTTEPPGKPRLEQILSQPQYFLKKTTKQTNKTVPQAQAAALHRATAVTAYHPSTCQDL